MKSWSISSRPSISTTTGIVMILIIIVVAAAASATILLSGAPASSSTSSINSSSALSTSTTVTSATPPSTTSLQKVTLLLDFSPTGYHALFYYGLDHGVYSSNGLDVTVLPGSGSGSTITAVSAGKADIGFADTGNLVVAATTANVTNVRVISIVFQKLQSAVVYNKARINSLSDMNGKTVGTYQGSGGLNLFKVLAKVNNLNYSSIKLLYTAPTTMNQLVAIGQADAVISTVNQVADIGPIATQNNIQLGSFQFSDYGLDIYGTSLITSTQMINNRPDVVQKFVKAALQSIAGAVGHPDDAIAALSKVNPQLKSAVSLGDFELMVKYTIPANVNSTSDVLTLGWINPQKMQNTVSVIAQGYNLNNPPLAANLYTNQFVKSP